MNKRSYVISALIILGMINSMAIRPGGGPGGATQSTMGRIVVLADSGPICDRYWSTSARTFTLNIFGWLTEFSPGKWILGNPCTEDMTNALIDADNMVDALRTNGYTISIITTIIKVYKDGGMYLVPSWTQALLEGKDAVIIVIDEYPIDNTLLIEYVNGGGGVFLIGGHSGFDKYKEFLLHFGMSLQERVYLGKELLTNFVPHPVTTGVSELKIGDPTPIEVHTSDPEILATLGGWNMLVVFSKVEAPTVTVVSPNGGEVWQDMQTITWTATDPQADPLTYTVYYSLDGGRTWIQLASGVTETSYQWDTSNVQVGENYLIKIEANDGRHTAEDRSDAPFTVERQVPTEIRSKAIFLPSFRVIEALGALFVILGLGKRRRRRNVIGGES